MLIPETNASTSNKAAAGSTFIGVSQDLNLTQVSGLFCAEKLVPSKLGCEYTDLLLLYTTSQGGHFKCTRVHLASLADVTKMA